MFSVDKYRWKRENSKFACYFTTSEQTSVWVQSSPGPLPLSVSLALSYSRWRSLLYNFFLI